MGSINTGAPRAPRLTVDDLLTGAEWLDYNEGEDGEQEACARVATFIRAEVRRRDIEATARRLRSESGGSLRRARERARAMFPREDRADKEVQS